MVVGFRTTYVTSASIPVSSTNKTDSHDIAKILLKMALSTINLNHQFNLGLLYEEKVKAVNDGHKFQQYRQNQKRPSPQIVEH